MVVSITMRLEDARTHNPSVRRARNRSFRLLNHPQLITDGHTTPLETAAVHLDDGKGTKRPGEAPRVEIVHDLQHPPGSIDEGHVDDESHEGGVNGRTGRDDERGGAIEA